MACLMSSMHPPSARVSLRQRTRPALLVYRDIGEEALGHLDALADTSASRPGLEVDRERRAALAHELAIDGHHVTHIDGADELRPVDGDGGDAPLSPLAGEDATGDIHLREHPAAENVAARIGVRRHGERSRRELAPWFLDLLVHQLRPSMQNYKAMTSSAAG
jgi:hypothetical protein